jgi:hypothetical protein
MMSALRLHPGVDHFSVGFPHIQYLMLELIWIYPIVAGNKQTG